MIQATARERHVEQRNRLLYFRLSVEKLNVVIARIDDPVRAADEVVVNDIALMLRYYLRRIYLCVLRGPLELIGFVPEG